MRRLPIILLGFLFLPALCGCLPRQIEHQVMERGTQAGAAFSDSRFEVVGTDEEFSRIYREIHSGVIPAPQPPPVDFDESVILVVAMGEKPTAGYAVEIGKLVRDDSSLMVEVRFVEPSSEQMQATVITRPYALISVERQPGLEKTVFIDAGGARLAEVPLN